MARNVDEYMVYSSHILLVDCVSVCMDAAPTNINMIDWPFRKYRFNAFLVPPHLFRECVCLNVFFSLYSPLQSYRYYFTFVFMLSLLSSDRVMASGSSVDVIFFFLVSFFLSHFSSTASTNLRYILFAKVD